MHYAYSYIIYDYTDKILVQPDPRDGDKGSKIQSEESQLGESSGEV